MQNNSSDKGEPPAEFAEGYDSSTGSAAYKEINLQLKNAAINTNKMTKTIFGILIVCTILEILHLTLN